MPNYYAHLYFGELVLSRLLQPLRGALLRERGAFQAGLFGPDPLFFGPGGCREIGVAAHRESLDSVEKRLGEREGPFAQSYGAGLLCHLLLDSRCHPWIDGEGKDRGLSHGGIEAELDRLLMEADSPRDLLPAVSLPRAFYETAAECYPPVTPREMERSLRRFLWVCRLQRRLTGLPIRAITERVPLTRGAIPGRTPDPAYREAARELRGLLEQSVPAAEDLLTSILHRSVPALV